MNPGEDACCLSGTLGRVQDTGNPVLLRRLAYHLQNRLGREGVRQHPPYNLPTVPVDNEGSSSCSFIFHGMGFLSPHFSVLFHHTMFTLSFSPVREPGSIIVPSRLQGYIPTSKIFLKKFILGIDTGRTLCYNTLRCLRRRRLAQTGRSEFKLSSKYARTTF